jgi:hypothetical protein
MKSAHIVGKNIRMKLPRARLTANRSQLFHLNPHQLTLVLTTKSKTRSFTLSSTMKPLNWQRRILKRMALSAGWAPTIAAECIPI